MKILHIAGARPNFVKIASIIKACKQTSEIESVLVHTGQHYSTKLSKTFFEELNIPEPNINLEVGSGSHAQQTAEIMKRIEPVLLNQKPDAMLVVGDVNSTIACALVAVKLGIKTIHVEAGLRSNDRAMPEEINRILTDAISDILFVSESSGIDNLKHEGIPSSRIHFVGNVMIDTLQHNLEKAELSNILEQMKLSAKQYAVLTLHRPSNVDDYQTFNSIIDALEEIQQERKVIFPIHPRTYNNLNNIGLTNRLEKLPGMIITEPLGYLDFLKLMSQCKIMLTDSGGIQEETTILGIPCLTLRENTERPITITEGTNTLVGTNKQRILEGYKNCMQQCFSKRKPRYWDGKAAERIAAILRDIL